MQFSIIIPTCNRPDLLECCLTGLFISIEQTSQHFIKVIVSDDSEDIKSKTMINEKFPLCEYIVGPKKGPASNRNHGASFANTEWLIFLDDDCIPDISLINAYIEAINTFPLVNIFEGRIYANGPKKSFDEESPLNENGGRLWSCNFCISKNLFDELGGFDESFPFAAMEDVDLHYRICQTASDIKFVYNASVLHPWRKHKGKSIIKKRHKSVEYFLRKHPRELKKYSSRYMVVSIINIIREFMKFGLLKFNYKAVSFYMIKLYYHFKLYSKIFKWKRSVKH